MIMAAHRRRHFLAFWDSSMFYHIQCWLLIVISATRPFHVLQRLNLGSSEKDGPTAGKRRRCRWYQHEIHTMPLPCSMAWKSVTNTLDQIRALANPAKLRDSNFMTRYTRPTPLAQADSSSFWLITKTTSDPFYHGQIQITKPSRRHRSRTMSWTAKIYWNRCRQCPNMRA